MPTKSRAACDALAAQIDPPICPTSPRLAIVGVVSHGAMLAMRLRDLIEAQTQVRPPCAALDVFGGDAAFHPLDGGGSGDNSKSRIARSCWSTT